MTTFIALLRGINVGKAKRVAMADLRSMVEGLGYRNVRTLLNSGNVVYDSTPPTQGASGPRIEKALEEQLGVSARVTVVSTTQFAEIVEGNTLAKPGRNPSRLLVHFLASPAARKRLEIHRDESWFHDIAIGRTAAYLWCPNGVLASTAAKECARVLRDDVTSRNWATVLKLQAMAAGEA